MAYTMAKSGILFVPTPVLNPNDHAKLILEVYKKLQSIAKANGEES